VHSNYITEKPETNIVSILKHFIVSRKPTITFHTYYRICTICFIIRGDV